MKTILGALKRKHKAIDKRLSQGLLPFLAKDIAHEPYLRMGNMAFNISLVGLNEAVRLHTGKQLYEDRAAVDYAATPQEGLRIAQIHAIPVRRGGSD